MTTPQKFAAVVLAAALPLAACGSESPRASDSADSEAATDVGTEDEVMEATQTTSGGSDAASRAKVSANDATVEEIRVAIAAAGVADAGMWATEIVGLRPYHDADEGFPKLREELGKRDPPAGDVDRIIAVLSE